MRIGTRAKKCGFLLILAVFLIITVLFVNLALVVFDMSYYQEQFEEHNRVEVSGMSEQELERVTSEILAYLRFQRDDIDITATVDGEEERLFTERELIHMEDVQELFGSGYVILALAVLVTLVGFIIGIKYLKKQQGFTKTGKAAPYLLNKVSLLSILITAVLGLILYLGIDFWYTQLHEWMFDNDYWLLNPDKHNLIRIFPVEFFHGTIFRIVLRTVGYLGLFYLISWTMIPGVMKQHKPSR